LRKTFIGVAAVLGMLSLAQPPARAAEHAKLVLDFGSMYGVDGPFLGEDNAIRGIAGDELPWVVDHVHGALTSDGRLTVVVHGLVFKDDPGVPANLRGKNDEDEFRAVVSCLTEGATDTPVANVTTEGFPATPSGNSFIHAKLTLPNPCVAPIVFILSGSEDAWFAVTGVETDD
jgi:hypothetical protein